MHLDRKTIHHVANGLEEIRREMNHMATGFYTPHILTQDMANYRAEQEEYLRQARAAQEAESHKPKRAETPELPL
jgi:hypothetical protein